MCGIAGFIGKSSDWQTEIRSMCDRIKHRGSDAEVLLEAIAEWGISEILERARGMLAFALFDRQENVVYLARDKMGEKPLYYGMGGRRFAFASDIACFEKMHNFSNSINQQALKLYFQHGYIPTPYSIYEGIYKLEAGTILKIDVNNFCRTSKVY